MIILIFKIYIPLYLVISCICVKYNRIGNIMRQKRWLMKLLCIKDRNHIFKEFILKRFF